MERSQIVLISIAVISKVLKKSKKVVMSWLSHEKSWKVLTSLEESGSICNVLINYGIFYRILSKFERVWKYPRKSSANLIVLKNPNQVPKILIDEFKRLDKWLEQFQQASKSFKELFKLAKVLNQFGRVLDSAGRSTDFNKLIKTILIFKNRFFSNFKVIDVSARKFCNFPFWGT